ncbi:hypothetical protein ACFQZF_14020 [Flavobacterium myungsuense]|uniref:hypothetical protein n=1 Tax=Flavobacterium myungsuense TaxID=651823 RepID=UPI003628B54C
MIRRSVKKPLENSEENKKNIIQENTEEKINETTPAEQENSEEASEEIRPESVEEIAELNEEVTVENIDTETKIVKKN